MKGRKALGLHRISTKVVLSLTLVVFFQATVSLLAITWILSRTGAASLDDQVSRTDGTVKRFFDDAIGELRVKSTLLAGQQKLIDYVQAGRPMPMSWDVTLLFRTLALDAIVILDSDLTPLADYGDPSIVQIARKRAIFSEENAAAGYVTTGEGLKIQLWSLSPVMRGGKRIGAVATAANLNRSFLGRLELISNSQICLVFSKDIIVNGRLNDETMLSFMQLLSEARTFPAAGKIGNLAFRLAELPQFKEMQAVYFIDISSTERLISEYATFSLAILIAALVLGFATSIALYRVSFHKPFAEFQAAIRRISDGDLSYSARADTKDEFGVLEREFETMTMNLQNLEQRLKVTSRMAAIGEMVAGVAHQIRNPLAVMKVSSDMLVQSLGKEGDPATQRTLTQVLSTEVGTLTVIIDKFLDFARPFSPNKGPVEVAPFLARVATLLPAGKLAGKAVRVDSSGCAGSAIFDPDLLEQALDNLLINGLEASAPGGEVALVCAEEGGELLLSVADRGPGIGAEDMKSVFHPFFTTKKGGTGLGLSIVHRIVEAHGGRVSVESVPGEGTVFTIRLPDAIIPA